VSEHARPVRDEPSAATDAAESAGVKAAGAWVSQLARTLKTCRLYDANNPTVVKFREDLASTLVQQLAEHGRMALSFTSNDVLAQEVSLYPARSRDDNLALPFYRDGIRSIAFEPGITPKEIETLLDAVLRVTRHDTSEEDLVTLLWDAELEHVGVDAASTEGDVETGAGAEDEGAGPVAPWPKGGAPPGTGSEPASPGDDSGPQQDRSDDRETGVQTANLQAVFRELEGSAAPEAERLRGECEREAGIPIARASLDLVRTCLHGLSDPAASAEVGAFLPRVLHESLTHGMWGDARDALALLRQCAIPGWSVEGLVKDLLQPASLTTRGVIDRLDAQDAAGVEAFVELARELGVEGMEWLMRVLAESREQRTRRLLLRLIAEMARDNPERLASWLADERWYVVRNVVHILGWMAATRSPACWARPRSTVSSACAARWWPPSRRSIPTSRGRSCLRCSTRRIPACSGPCSTSSRRTATPTWRAGCCARSRPRRSRTGPTSRSRRSSRRWRRPPRTTCCPRSNPSSTPETG